MQKAFVFDMDGVIIDSERLWSNNPLNEQFIIDLFGEKIYDVIKDEMMGGDSETWYKIAIKHGFTMELNEYYRAWDTHMKSFYPYVPITEGVDLLVSYLVSSDFRIALVSSSRMNWINEVLPRLSFRKHIEYITSVNDREDLRGKPAPDGYIDAIKHLDSTPERTIILEDSNRGIKAAKASGGFTIGFSGNLLDGYEQEGADAYAKTMPDVVSLVKEWGNSHD